MSTVLLCPELFAADGGIARILRLYLRALGEEEPAADIVVIVLNDHAVPHAALANYTAGRTVRVVACARRRSRFVAETLRWGARASRIICGHVHLLPVARIPTLLNRQSRVYLIAHGTEIWTPRPWLQRRALAGTTRIWCVSDYTRSQLLRHQPALANRTVVLPNALDPNLEGAPASLPARSGPRRVLTVSRLDPGDAYKGVDALIDAWPDVLSAEPGVQLLVVGRGSDRARLKARVHELDLANHVRFLGSLSDAALREAFAACDAFALPSTGEGFGLVYVEAMAAGRPCLAANAGGSPEVVDAASGVLVPPGDRAALVDGCIRLLRTRWDPLAIRARAAHFSFERFRERLRHVW